MDNVFNVIEVSGSSTESWERAALDALDQASHTLDGPLSEQGPLRAEVLQQDMAVDERGELMFHIALAVSVEIDLRAEQEQVGLRPKRFLVVANQTLASPGLEQLVHEMVAKQPSHFHVVVPQVSSSTIHVDPAGLVDASVYPGSNDMYVVARREAENRLSTFRQLFEETHEATLTGEVIVGDPLQAVHRVMARSEFDEIVVSTLPAGVSKWLRMDLPHRIERAVDVPVTSLVQELAESS
jgi:flavin-binding protein dodecin